MPSEDGKSSSGGDMSTVFQACPSDSSYLRGSFKHNLTSKKRPHRDIHLLLSHGGVQPQQLLAPSAQDARVGLPSSKSMKESHL